jgi:hypothetical protein
VTAGTAEIQVNSKGKIKTIGAPLGVWIDILLAQDGAATATPEADCHIKSTGSIKAGVTKVRKVSAKKLTKCYLALKLTTCPKHLRVRVTANAGMKYKEGRASKLELFAPPCAVCPPSVGA